MGTTTLDLFRVGNASGARLSHVRPVYDVVIFTQNGVEWVRGRSGGVSTFDVVDPNVKGVWWRLPSGNAYNDAVLTVVNDTGNHWSWEPLVDMPLASYRAALASANVNFIRV